MLGQLQPIALLNAIHSACDDITSVLKVTVVGFVNCDVTEHWWILEHSNSRFESIRFVMRIDSFSKKIGLSIH